MLLPAFLQILINDNKLLQMNNTDIALNLILRFLWTVLPICMFIYLFIEISPYYSRSKFITAHSDEILVKLETYLKIM